MVEIMNAQEFVIGRSKNLRGILERARKQNTFVETVRMYEHDDGSATLEVWWADDSYSACQFASAEVCYTWIHARRSWKGAWLHTACKRKDGSVDCMKTERL